MKFITNNLSHSALHVSYKEEFIEGTANIKFFSLQTDNHLNRKNHIEQMSPNLIWACYAIRLMVHINNIDTLKSIYYVYFHFVIKYGIIFWGNSYNSGKIFTLQKKFFRIMAGAQPRTSYRSLFEQSEQGFLTFFVPWTHLRVWWDLRTPSQKICLSG
jgi:hypothetical protein